MFTGFVGKEKGGGEGIFVAPFCFDS